MSTNGKTTSLKSVVERVYKDFKFNYSLAWDDALEWTGSLLALLRCPVILQPQTALITIKEGRGKLPCNLESIVQTARACPVEGASEQMIYAVVSQDSGTFFVEGCGIDLINQELKTDCPTSDTTTGCQYSLSPMRWATNSFHTGMHANIWDFGRENSENTYIVNGNYIFTSFSEGFVMMAYNGIPIDKEGFPLIPDDEWWRNAVKWELAYRIAFILYLQDNINSQKFQLIERDRDWYVAQAVNKSKIPSLDEMESWKNQHVRSIPVVNQHANFFRNLQSPEQRYNHPLQYNW